MFLVRPTLFARHNITVALLRLRVYSEQARLIYITVNKLTGLFIGRFLSAIGHTN